MILFFKNTLRALRNFLVSLKQEYKRPVPGCGATVLLSGKDFFYDRNPYREIFFEEIYKTNYKNFLVLDIGAHKGYFTTYALFHGAGRVYAYEPSGFNFKFLEKNVRINNFMDKTLLFNKAVASESGERDFFIMQSSASHSLVARQDRHIIKKVRVPAISINEVLANTVKEGQKIIFKLDVEGGEYEIIPTIEDTYFGLIDKFFVEYHDVPGCSQQAMNAYLKQKGFALEREMSDREFLFSRP